MLSNSTRAQAPLGTKRGTATVPRLYSELKRAREVVDAIQSKTQKVTVERAAARLGRVAARIAKAPADTLDEAALKIEAVMQDGDYNDALDCLHTLREDLRRMQAHAKMGGRPSRRQTC